MADAEGDLVGLMARTTVEEIAPEPTPPAGKSGKTFWAGIVTVSESDSVRKAFEKLVANNILSAPVRTVGPAGSELMHKYAGFVDMVDLVAFVVASLGELSNAPTVDELKHRLHALDELFDRTTVRQLLDRSSARRSTAYFPIPETMSVWGAADMLAGTGAQRVPVLSPSSHVSNVISQTSIIKFLHSHRNRIPQSFLQSKVGDLEGVEPAETLPSDALALEACKRLVEKKVDAVAIVEDGKVVGSFSVRDLRGVGLEADHVFRLFLPVQMFKRREGEDFPDQPPAPVVVTAHDTLGHALDLFVANKVHRVWLVDSHAHPKGCVTIQNLLKKFANK